MVGEMTNIALDDLDRRLIGLLRADSRSPAVALARALGVSRATVQNRIAKLQRGGAIIGFSIRLASEEAAGVRALASLEIRSGDEKAVRQGLKRLPEVSRLYSTNGRWDMIAELHAADLGALDRALGAIRAIRGVAHSETSICLSEL